MTVYNWAITRKGTDPAQYWYGGDVWGMDPEQAYRETTRTACEDFYRANGGGTLKGVVAVRVSPFRPGEEPVEEFVPEFLGDAVELDVASVEREVRYGPNWELDTLASEANRWHSQAEGHARSAVECAYHAGQALLAAKERGKQTGQIPHGKFQDWVEAHFNGSYRTAARYMALVRKVPRVSLLGQGLESYYDDSEAGLDGPGLAVGSINAALRALSPPKAKPPKADPEVPRLTKARRSYLIQELGRLREFLSDARDDSYSTDELTGVLDREVPEWTKVLAEVTAIIAEAEAK